MKSFTFRFVPTRDVFVKFTRVRTIRIRNEAKEIDLGCRRRAGNRFSRTGKAKSLAGNPFSRTGKVKSLAGNPFSCAGKAKSLAGNPFSRTGKVKSHTGNRFSCVGKPKSHAGNPFSVGKNEIPRGEDVSGVRLSCTGWLGLSHIQSQPVRLGDESDVNDVMMKALHT